MKNPIRTALVLFQRTDT